MTNIRKSILASAMLLTSCAAFGDVWKCVDSQGGVAYTNTKPTEKGCKLLSQDQPVSTISGPKPRPSAATPTPGNFPRVDSGLQKERDLGRRQILDREIAQEQSLLDKAQKELSEQEAIRTGDERNYQKVLERLKPYQDRVAEHQRNIDAIRQELNKLR